jgi:DNA-binding NtrC family response regulator
MQQSDSTRERPAILVVDSSSMVREVCRMSLESAGYLVVCSATGTEALAQAGSATFHAVLLEIMLPDMAGIDLIERFAESGAITRAIFMGGFPLAELPERYPARALRCYFLQKPFTAAQLRSIVRTACEEA